MNAGAHTGCSVPATGTAAAEDIVVAASWRIEAGDRLLAAAAALVLVAVTAAQTYHFLPWNFDDAYIIFRIARNILNGQGWTFNLGDVHNPSTSVLNTVLVVAVAKLTAADILITAHVIAGVSLGTAALAFAWLFACRFGIWVGLAVGLALVNLFSHNATWGLETHLALALIALFLVAERESRNPWALIGLIVLARPDAALIAALRWLRSWWKGRSLSARGVALCLSILSPWIVFSLIRFHQVFPDTLSNKMWQGRSGYWGTGWIYLRGLVQHVIDSQQMPSIAYVLSVPGVVLLIRDRNVLLYLVAFAVLQQAAYVMMNVPAYHWYFSLFDAAVLLAAMYAVGSAFHVLVGAPHATRRRIWVTHAALLAVIAATVVVQLRTAAGEQAHDVRDLAYRKAIGAMQTDGLPPGPLAAVEVGTFGYYLADHPVIDLIGLASANVEFVTGKNNDQFFRHAPAIVLFHQPIWPHERAVYDDLRFRMMYDAPVQIRDTAIQMQYFRRKAGATMPTESEIAAYVAGQSERFQLQLEAPALEATQADSVECALDEINGRPAGSSSFTVPRTVLGLRGWAVDRAQLGIEQDVLVVLSSGNRRYAMRAARVSRPDVARHFNDPMLQMAGFELTGSLLDVPGGDYRISGLQKSGDFYLACDFSNLVTVE